jgi:hypothetical protein
MCWGEDRREDLEHLLACSDVDLGDDIACWKFLFEQGVMLREAMDMAHEGTLGVLLAGAHNIRTWRAVMARLSIEISAFDRAAVASAMAVPAMLAMCGMAQANGIAGLGDRLTSDALVSDGFMKGGLIAVAAVILAICCLCAIAIFNRTEN